MTIAEEKIFKLADSVRYEILYDMTFDLKMSDFVKFQLERIKELNEKYCKILR